MRLFALLAGTSIAALALAAPAYAQDESEEEIVVTGTSIRGIAPAGANVIGVTEEAIEETGASSALEVLQNLPQGEHFQGLPAIGGNVAVASDLVPITRPSLRSIPGVSISGAPMTLMLLDGGRLVPAGISQVGVDPGVVPAALLQRVDILPDGASAVYGSDSVGGVINYITRNSYDGIEASARYGFADNYEASDYSLTAGTDWGSGSVFGSLSYSQHNALYGRDRDYIRAINWTTGRGLELSCNPGNVVIGSNRYYPLNADGTVGAQSAIPQNCESSDSQTLYPEEYAYNIYTGLSQELTDTLTFDVRAMYSERTSVTNLGPFRSSVTVAPGNPNYQSVTGPDAGATQTVRFSYAPVVGEGASKRRTEVALWQVTPSLAWDVGGDWQIRGSATYGESETAFRNNGLRPGIQALVNSGQINPYDVAASDPAILSDLVRTSRGDGEFEYTNYRVIADGPLLQLPGGRVHAAIGAEYGNTDFRANRTNAAFIYDGVGRQSYTQSVESAFGELNIPIFGEGNALPFVQSLSLSLSARLDRYSDFGETANPLVGLTYEPVDWLTIRSSWGQSYTAPAVTDQVGVQNVTLVVSENLPGDPIELPVGVTAPIGSLQLIMNAGTVNNLQPQTSENYSVGFDVRPPFIPGFSLSLSYYSISIFGTLRQPLSSNVQQVIDQFPNLYQLNLTSAQAEAILRSNQVPEAQIERARDFFDEDRPVAILIDARGRNLGNYYSDGFDFAASYAVDTDYGVWDASVSGYYALSAETQNFPGAPRTNMLALDTSDLKWSAGVGLTTESWRARLTWNHSEGFSVNPVNNAGQTEVDDFDTFDAFVSYDLPGSGITEDARLSLQVSNLLDEDPPLVRRSDFIARGFTNGFTLGRFVQVGLTKRF